MNLYAEAVRIQGEVIAKQADQIELLKMDRNDLQQALEESKLSWFERAEVVGPLAFVLGVGLGAYATRGK